MGVILRLRHSLRALAVGGLALLTGAGALPAAAAAPDAARGERPSAGGLSAVIRYTEYGIPHILADDYADLGFGDGWAQAADAVCTLADGFVTVRGERARYFGPDAAPDRSLSDASTNLSSDLFFRGVRDARTVEKLLDRPAPEGPSRQARELMRGWAAGYDAWLRQNEITDPACRGKDWVRPVTATDVARRGYALTVLGGQGALADAITGPVPRPPGPPPAAGRAPIRPPPPARTSPPGTTPGWARTPSRSRAPPRRTGAVCCWATRTTPGTAAAASGSRSRRSRVN